MSGLYKYFPIPSDKMGILWALSSIKDSCIIEYGPGGTTHYSMEGIFKINGTIEADTYTTHIDEDDVVMGDTSKLRKTLLEVDAVYCPKYIFVVASSLISVIGTDIIGVINALRDQINAEIIVYESGGFKGDYTDGIRQVFCDIAKYIVHDSKQIDNKCYNLIGCCVDDYRFAANVNAVKNTLSCSLDLKCGCVFTSESSIDQLEQASSATINIVLRQEGIACAEILKERFGTEYIYAMPLGYEATLAMIEKIATVLDIKPNVEYMEQQKKHFRQRLMYIRRHLKKILNKKAVISGGYDYVLAMEKFLYNEVGFTIGSALVNHKRTTSSAPEHYIFSASEDVKVAELNRCDPEFIFGDAVLLKFANRPCFKLQMQNPNLDQILITKHKPYMCFDGADDIVEKLLNY